LSDVIGLTSQESISRTRDAWHMLHDSPAHTTLTAALDFVDGLPEFRMLHPKGTPRDPHGWHAQMYQSIVSVMSLSALIGEDPIQLQEANRRRVEAARRGALARADHLPNDRYPGVAVTPPQPWYTGAEHADIRRVREELRQGLPSVLHAWKVLARSQREGWCTAGEVDLQDTRGGGMWTWTYCPVVGRGNLFVNESKVGPLVALLRRIDAIAPVSFARFVRLRGGSRVKPHSGISNQALRTVVTLDDGCGDMSVGQAPCASITVGGLTRHFVGGEILTFDDAFLHEVVNSGPEDRSRLTFLVETRNPLVLPCSNIY